MFGSEDRARDLSPGAVFKAYSSGLYRLPALMTGLCRAQLPFPKGKTTDGEEELNLQGAQQHSSGPLN